MSTTETTPSLNHRTELNLDVLLHIIEISTEYQSSLALMSTCKFFRNAGCPILLQQTFDLHTTPEVTAPELAIADDYQYHWDIEAIEISGADKIDSFCLFLLADLDRRPPFLRSLIIRFCETEATPSIQLLPEVLRRCTGLRKLVMPSCEATLRSMVHILGPIVSLTNIASFEVNRLGPLSSALVSGMQSQLIALDYTAAREHPFTTFRLLVAQLASLSSVTFRTLNWDSMVRHSYVMTSLQILHIFGSFLPRIGHLLRAFPNLRTLSLEELIDLPQSRPWEEEVRGKNRDSQSVNRWKELDTIHASLSELYVLAPRCPINRLSLSLAGYDYELEGLAMPKLRSVLNDCTPRAFTLRSIPPDFFNDTAAEGLFAISGMIELSLDVYIPVDTDMTDLMDTFKRSLRGSFVHDLHLTFTRPRMFKGFRRDLGDVPGQPPTADPVREFLHSQELKVILSGIAQDAPLLRIVSVTRRSFGVYSKCYSINLEVVHDENNGHIHFVVSSQVCSGVHYL